MVQLGLHRQVRASYIPAAQTDALCPAINALVRVLPGPLNLLSGIGGFVAPNASTPYVLELASKSLHQYHFSCKQRYADQPLSRLIKCCCENHRPSSYPRSQPGQLFQCDITGCVENVWDIRCRRGGMMEISHAWIRHMLLSICL